MKFRLAVVGLLCAAWLATGFYIVRGNERAVVRRFGRPVSDGAVSESTGPRLVGSGLHFDLPWPLAVVDRVNLHQIRTLSIGATTGDEASDSAFLREFEPADRSQFLTGDKNILHIRVDVQYRIAADEVAAHLFGSVSTERRLQALSESLLTGLVTETGVDAVHTFGRAELQGRLAGALRHEVDRQRLGVEIESVSVEDVRPPIRVKAAFLDVNDARADREKFVQSALAVEQRRHEQARGEARRIEDEAESYRVQETSSAKATSESFDRLVAQLKTESLRTGATYAAVRNRALRRRYYDDMAQILKTVASKVVLETGRQVDITILKDALR